MSECIGNFYIRTFGCQMNKNDSTIIAEMLRQSGYSEVLDHKQADVFIVNTCSVRQHAEQRALGFIASLQGWKCGGRIVAVVGCMAQRLADDIAVHYPFVDIILGPDGYRRIAEFVKDVSQVRTRIIVKTLSNEEYCGIYPQRSGVTGFVSIMRGCDNFCSYCVVPYVRGRVRSRPADDVATEVKRLVQSGVKGITLLGQNVNEYQYDATDFATLLELLAVIPGVFRLRFLTSHPKDLNSAIIHAVKEQNTICEWFHLPLQSGNNRILELMNRRYTSEVYLELVERIRSEIPEATITTDVIAGFPTETEEEFCATVDIMKKIRFDDAYLYRYSSRTGTKACEYSALPENVVKQRLQELIRIQDMIGSEKTHEMIGRTFEILIESPAKGNTSRGKTRGNKDVVIDEMLRPGDVKNVEITEVRGRTAIGAVI